MNKIKRTIAIDAGNKISGMVILDDGIIVVACVISNEDIYNKIASYSIHRDLTIVVEDIRPYSLKLTQQVIDTCKFIGELNCRLRIMAGFDVRYICRSEVRKWVYDTFPLVCEPLIDVKIEAKMYSACIVATKEEVRVNGRGGNKRKSSFIYIDDKMVVASMKHLYKIAPRLPGKGYEYGLKTHAFQALALGRYSMTAS